MDKKRVAYTFIIVFFATLCLLPTISFSLSDGEDKNGNNIIGYTEIASTSSQQNFQGSLYDKVIPLDNGMVFKCILFYDLYAYHPLVSVYVREYTLDEVRKVQPNATHGIIGYKLLIDDHIIDVERLR